MSLFKNEVGRPSNRIKKIRLGIVLSIVAIITLTIVFAALSSTLTINGNAKFSGKWNIHFDNYSATVEISKEKTGYAKYSDTAEIVTPDKTTINYLDVTMGAPGDSVTYKFSIVNEGTIAGKISDLNIAQGNIVADDSDILDLIKLHFKHTFKYEGTEDDVLENDVIEAGESKKVVLTYYLDDFDYEGSFNLSSGVKISDLSVTSDYAQYDGANEEDPIVSEELGQNCIIYDQNNWNYYSIDPNLINSILSSMSITGVTPTLLESIPSNLNGYSYGDMDNMIMGTFVDDEDKGEQIKYIELTFFNEQDSIPSSVLGYPVTRVIYQMLGSNITRTATLPTSVTSLSDVFFGCTNLTDIYYAGTVEQYKNISRWDESGAPSGTTVHCSDGNFTLE